ncbi:hypothetical protein GGX14DRAFT_387550 [Mycena pura]|uniref:Uncharacterized protein n=1 Tax=Mycena pura TaxID=153505 RepID=A0AAD6YLS3_9AGAR|nr:hypothetical protein GGX14DRAFT_387550 [Mycena pura]
MKLTGLKRSWIKLNGVVVTSAKVTKYLACYQQPEKRRKVYSAGITILIKDIRKILARASKADTTANSEADTMVNSEADTAVDTKAGSDRTYGRTDGDADSATDSDDVDCAADSDVSMVNEDFNDIPFPPPSKACMSQSSMHYESKAKTRNTASLPAPVLLQGAIYYLKNSVCRNAARVAAKRSEQRVNALLRTCHVKAEDVQAIDLKQGTSPASLLAQLADRWSAACNAADVDLEAERDAATASAHVKVKHGAETANHWDLDTLLNWFDTQNAVKVAKANFQCASAQASGLTDSDTASIANSTNNDAAHMANTAPSSWVMTSNSKNFADSILESDHRGWSTHTSSM